MIQNNMLNFIEVVVKNSAKITNWTVLCRWIDINNVLECNARISTMERFPIKEK